MQAVVRAGALAELYELVGAVVALVRGVPLHVDEVDAALCSRQLQRLSRFGDQLDVGLRVRDALGRLCSVLRVEHDCRGGIWFVTLRDGSICISYQKWIIK